MTVQEEAQWCIQNDGMLAEIRKKLRRGKATHADTAAYSARAGGMIGALLSRRLPEIPPEEREQLCVELLHGQYIDINAAVDAAQSYMDKALGIHLTPQHPAFDGERAHQIGSSTADPTVPLETQQRRARSATETMVKSMHDDRMKAEAKSRSRLGLDVTIERNGTDCCPWCVEVAGRYPMGEEPEGIFRRHDNCDCTVIYGSQVLRGAVGKNGKRTKTWEEVDPKKVRGTEPVVLTAEQAAEIEAKHLPTVLTNGRNRSIIKAITVDDIISAGKINPEQPSAITEEVATRIIDTITSAKSAGGRFSFDEVRVISIPRKAGEELIVFQTNAVDHAGIPHVILEINLDAVGDLDAEHVDLLFSTATNTKCKSLADAIIHEIGHAKTIERRTFANYERIAEELADVHMDGISTLAKKDGLELIAECEVILAHGGTLAPEIMKIYTTYTTGGG